VSGQISYAIMRAAGVVGPPAAAVGCTQPTTMMKMAASWLPLVKWRSAEAACCMEGGRACLVRHLVPMPKFRQNQLSYFST
jgi:hypothetical protein